MAKKPQLSNYIANKEDIAHTSIAEFHNKYKARVSSVCKEQELLECDKASSVSDLDFSRDEEREDFLLDPDPALVRDELVGMPLADLSNVSAREEL